MTSFYIELSWFLCDTAHKSPLRSSPEFTLRFSGTFLFGLGCVLMLAAVALPVSAQIVVKNEDVTFKFGVQGQLWGDWTQDSSGPQGYQQNFYRRPARPTAGADVGNK